MSDISAEVRRWRERQEQARSLSPRELDELEDHLRARADLEMELDPMLAPGRAFAIARHELGTPKTLSKEFAKAGRPRWRRWVVAGWTAYAASWFLPILDMGWLGTMTGYDVLKGFTSDIFGTAVLLAINLPMLMTVSMLWGARLSCDRWLRRMVGAVGVLAIGCAVGVMVYGSIDSGSVAWLFPFPFLVGSWAWAGSFLFVTQGLRLRAKEWESATPETRVRLADRGVSNV
ncbi:MAG: hypothetical protein F4187_05255 [Gemmatimonadetes bacterium]|nr:hypothetical protein [Gemmatimonadota bacterium]MYI07296.1 hypothetical protein [Gemmatimonadota bacterium]